MFSEHANSTTTEIYTHVTTKGFDQLKKVIWINWQFKKKTKLVSLFEDMIIKDLKNSISKIDYSNKIEYLFDFQIVNN